MSKAKFKGILAVGRTAQDARNQYKLLAIGKGATVQMGGGNCFVTHSSGENMFNPLTGDMDLEVNAAYMENLQFQANAGDVPDSANHFKCQSGCGAHIVTDMSEISYCPNCTSEAVVAADEADSEEDADTGSDAGSDADEGSDAGSDADSDAGAGSESDADSDLAVVSGNTEDDKIAVVASSLEEAQRIYNANKVGIAEAGDDAHVEYVVCSNAECGGHIVSDEVLHACPACNSAVKEPSLSGEGSDAESDEGSDVSDADVGSDAEVTAGSDADSDADATSDSDAESDADAGSDEGSDAAAEAGDDDGVAVVAASRAEAEQMFAEQMIGKVEAGAEAAEAHYVVCSSAECGAHIIGTAAVADCPVCHASTEEPESDEGSDADSDAGAGSESDADSDAGSESDADAAATASGSGEDSDAGADSESDTESLNLTDGEGNTLDENTSDVDATAVIDDSAEAKDLDVSYSSVQGEGTWTAFYKGTPVALAKRTDAGKNADVFDKPAFGQVLLATASHSNIKSALSELGFKPIKHQVSVSAEVQRMVDERAKEAIAAAEAAAKQFKDSFLAALATAAAGINRNFFKDVAANPLKGGLWTTLSSAGMQNPEVLIDKAFAAHADEYHKILVAKACEILEQPSEVQASLASAVQNSNYQAVASGGGNLEDRLAGLGTVVASESKPAAEEENFEATAGADDVLHQAVRTLGRR